MLALNPVALRKAKIVCNFGLSECNRVKVVFLIRVCTSESSLFATKNLIGLVQSNRVFKFKHYIKHLFRGILIYGKALVQKCLNFGPLSSKTIHVSVQS